VSQVCEKQCRRTCRSVEQPSPAHDGREVTVMERRDNTFGQQKVLLQLRLLNKKKCHGTMDMNPMEVLRCS
jgi:hypothetical protein